MIQHPREGEKKILVHSQLWGVWWICFSLDQQQWRGFKAAPNTLSATRPGHIAVGTLKHCCVTFCGVFIIILNGLCPYAFLCSAFIHMLHMLKC